VSEESKLVCVRSCQGWDLAQIFKSKLEAAGIPVLLKYESAGLVFGITVDGLGEVKIMVPEAHAQEAENLLREQHDVEFLDDDGFADDDADSDSEHG
jgi:hypothetical protein